MHDLHYVSNQLLSIRFPAFLLFSLETRLEIFSSISATKSVPVSPVLFFEILRGHIASPPRAKIGQALSPCERELVLINNVLTSEAKAAKKELFIGTLHALSSNILRLALCRRRKSFLRGSLEKSLAEVSFGKGFISAVWCPYLKNGNEENMKKVFILCFDALVA